jgi:hypothetical protein
MEEVWKSVSEIADTLEIELESGKDYQISNFGNFRIEDSEGNIEEGHITYSDSQATTYGILVGASEGGLQYLLGGIGKLGGKFTQQYINKAISKIDNGLARVAIAVGMDAVGEGFEESVQPYIESAVKSLVMNEDFNAPDIDEVVFSGIMGALMGAMYGGGSSIAGQVNLSQYGSQYSGDIDTQKALVQEGIELGTLDEKRANRYTTRLNKGKSLSNTQLGLVAQGTQSHIIKDAVKRSLE